MYHTFGMTLLGRLWWMMPMIVMLMLIGGLIVFAQSSAIASFINTLF
jgi:hypothetical protein